MNALLAGFIFCHVLQTSSLFDKRSMQKRINFFETKCKCQEKYILHSIIVVDSEFELFGRENTEMYKHGRLTQDEFYYFVQNILNHLNQNLNLVVVNMEVEDNGWKLVYDLVQKEERIVKFTSLK